MVSPDEAERLAALFVPLWEQLSVAGGDAAEPATPKNSTTPRASATPLAPARSETPAHSRGEQLPSPRAQAGSDRATGPASDNRTHRGAATRSFAAESTKPSESGETGESDVAAFENSLRRQPAWAAIAVAAGALGLAAAVALIVFSNHRAAPRASTSDIAAPPVAAQTERDNGASVAAPAPQLGRAPAAPAALDSAPAAEGPATPEQRPDSPAAMQPAPSAPIPSPIMATPRLPSVTETQTQSAQQRPGAPRLSAPSSPSPFEASATASAPKPAPNSKDRGGVPSVPRAETRPGLAPAPEPAPAPAGEIIRDNPF